MWKDRIHFFDTNLNLYIYHYPLHQNHCFIYYSLSFSWLPPLPPIVLLSLQSYHHWQWCCQPLSFSCWPVSPWLSPFHPTSASFSVHVPTIFSLDFHADSCHSVILVPHILAILHEREDTGNITWCYYLEEFFSRISHYLVSNVGIGIKLTNILGHTFIVPSWMYLLIPLFSLSEYTPSRLVSSAYYNERDNIAILC